MVRPPASPVPLERWCGHCGRSCLKRSTRAKCPHCHHHELCDYLPTLQQIEQACKLIQDGWFADGLWDDSIIGRESSRR